MEKMMLAAVLIIAGMALAALSGTMFFVYNYMLVWLALYLSGVFLLLLGVQVVWEK